MSLIARNLQPRLLTTTQLNLLLLYISDTSCSLKTLTNWASNRSVYVKSPLIPIKWVDQKKRTQRARKSRRYMVFVGLVTYRFRTKATLFDSCIVIASLPVDSSDNRDRIPR